MQRNRVSRNAVRQVALAAGLGMGMATPPALAAELSAPEIRQMIVGKVVKLKTPFGIEVPLRYRADGIVAGDVSGISAASMLAPREEGRWWLAGNLLCQKWPSWYGGRQFCFTITDLGGGKIGWLRDDGAKGTAVIRP